VFIRLAEFQVRLLLCTPAERCGGEMRWNCGCYAQETGIRKYQVEACEAHAGLLRQVREDDEPTYDSFSAPMLRNPHERFA
jgi:hypothetical protein